MHQSEHRSSNQAFRALWPHALFILCTTLKSQFQLVRSFNRKGNWARGLAVDYVSSAVLAFTHVRPKPYLPFEP